MAVDLGNCATHTIAAVHFPWSSQEMCPALYWLDAGWHAPCARCHDPIQTPHTLTHVSDYAGAPGAMLYFRRSALEKRPNCCIHCKASREAPVMTTVRFRNACGGLAPVEEE
jgi:hypothetical protein